MEHRNGTPLAWAGDLALLGLVCGIACPAGAKWILGGHDFLAIPTAFMVIAGLVGTASGAVFGAGIGWVLRYTEDRTPIWMWGLPMWIGFGAWGGLTVATPTALYAGGLWPFALGAGVFSGLAQGAWSIPLAFFAFRRGWPRWPMHMAACVFGVPIGVATIFLVPPVVFWVATLLSALIGWPM